MKPGDIVWFKRRDDVKFGNYCLDETDEVAGKIIKIDTYRQYGHVYWIATLPIINQDTVPLWGIPRNLVKPIKDEEAMLIMLEN